MIRLFVNLPLKSEKELILKGPQSHYLQRVMRLKKGERVLLFNGKEGEWLAEMSDGGKRHLSLIIISQTQPQSDEGDLWILFSPLKPKRQEFLVEKATELGVACIWPVKCERTTLSKVNLKKIEDHSREAVEQCGRLTLPEIKPLLSLKRVLGDWPKDRKLLFGDETLTSPLREISIDKTKKYAFLVGPEGGFTAQELLLLRSHSQVQGVTLNPHILRAETAALVGVSYLQLSFDRTNG